MIGLLGTDRMENHGTAHLTMLVLTVVACVLCVIGLRRLRAARGAGAEHRATQTAGWVLLGLTVAWTGFRLLPENFALGSSLPLQYSDALRVIAAVALITRARWAVAVSFYWGLTLNLQSLITPDLNYLMSPLLSFSAYWVLHIGVFLVPVVFLGALGHRPDWRGYRLSYAVTVGWAALAMAVNAAAGTNYGYLNGAPEQASLLDLLGPWPVYILWEAVLIAAVWALMTWPFTRRSRSRRHRRGGGTGAARRRRPAASPSAPSARRP